MPNLSDQLQSLVSSLREFESLAQKGMLDLISTQSDLDSANKTIEDLRQRIKKLEAGGGGSDNPHLPNTPNVSITFGPHILKPNGPGEIWPLSGERRWFWDVDDQVRVILDAKSDGLNSQEQIRIILQRCWADEKTGKTVSMSMPVYESHVKVEIDGQVMYDAPIRLHYGQRSAKTFRRHQLLMLAIKDLGDRTTSDKLPNYSRTIDLSDTKSAVNLTDMTSGTHWYWKGWEEVNPPGTYDVWSETYGFVVNSWTGGGAPSANEASMFSPWDVALLLSGDQRLAAKCLSTADTSGNYLIHYYSKESGQSYTYLDSGKLPFTLVETNLPSSATASGKQLPKPDLAHCLGLPDLAALVTGERFYIEELESWVLIGTLCRKPSDRSSGIYFSGQVRATAWWLRNLFHLVQACPEGSNKALYESQLVANLKYLSRTFADPSSPQFKPDGVLATLAIRPSPMTKYADPTAKEQINTGNLYFLTHVLAEIYQAGYKDALPMIGLLSTVSREVWRLSPNPILAPWFQHIYQSGGWAKIIAATFHSLPESTLNATAWTKTPIYIDYIAWYRASIVGIIDCLPGETWAREALTWIDGRLAKEGRQLPMAWAIQPRK